MFNHTGYPGIAHVASHLGDAKLHWIEVMTLEKTIKFGTVAPSQARCLTHIPMGDF